MVKRKPLRIEWTHHGEYFKIACDNYGIVERLRKEHDELQARLKGKTISDEDVDQLGAKNDAIGELAITIVIFSALALEAYINHYGITRLSKNYFTTYLDKLDIFAKWVVVPRIVAGKQLDPGSKSLQELGWLIRLRNKLVHYKSKEIKVEELKESDFLWDHDAQRAIKAVRHLISNLSRIDKKVDTYWTTNTQ